ncbi:MAG: hypothetical protein J6V48_00910 [Clostridia bacterium]|nr:hypothetical protein [Clostridia bacterium]
MRKLITALLAAVMIVSMFVIGVSAEPVVINNAEDWANMAADGDYKLGADITVDAIYANKFTGTIDGNGKTITTSVTLFNEFEGSISNLTIAGDINVNDAGVRGAAIARTITKTGNVTFENIVNNAKVYNCDAAGALFAYGTYGCTITIKNCVNNADITGDNQVGGLGGYTQGKILTIENSENNGKIESTGNYSAGIVSRFGKDDALAEDVCTIKNCKNTGEVIAKQSQVGGMIGYHVGTIVIDGCVNSGNITNLDGSSGGISGSGSNKDHNSLVITNCENSGTITATLYSAGIAGKSGTVQADGKYYFENCTNTGEIILQGNVVKTGGASGIVGYLYGGSTGNGVVGCKSLGNVTVKDTTTTYTADVNSVAAAGLISYVNGAATFIKDNVVTGTITNLMTPIADDATEGGLKAAQILCVQLFYNKSTDGIGPDYASGNKVKEIEGAVYEINAQYGPSYTFITEEQQSATTGDAAIWFAVVGAVALLGMGVAVKTVKSR